MKVNEFLEKLNKALNVNTCYLQGGFGCRLWVPDWYSKTYSWNKANAEIINAHSSPSQHCFGFDCVCLIKGVLWGFDADINKNYGGAVYKSNGVPDCTGSALAAACPDYSTTFAIMPEPGEILFYDKNASHVGVYIGDGQVIEATPSWTCGVQKTLLSGFLNPDRLPVRSWYAHGHLSYIDYSKPETDVDYKKAFTELSDKYAKLQSTNNDLLKQITVLEMANNSLTSKIERIKEVIGK